MIAQVPLWSCYGFPAHFFLHLIIPIFGVTSFFLKEHGYSFRWRLGKGVERHVYVPHEGDDAASVVPSLGGGGAVVDPRLVEVLEVEHVHLRILAAGLFDALGIVGVVVPFSLTARQHFLPPHFITQIAVQFTSLVVGIGVNRMLVYLCTDRDHQSHQRQDTKQFLHLISFRTMVRPP